VNPRPTRGAGLLADHKRYTDQRGKISSNA